MSLVSEQIVALAEELRGVLTLAREGKRRDLQRLVGVIGRDMKDLARQIAAVEMNPKLDRDYAAACRARYERETNENVAKIASSALEYAFEPHGFFVYLLWGQDQEKPLYVGQSTNILTRLGDHLGDGDKHEHILQVALIRCDDRRAMDDTERRLIRRYSPPWNCQMVPHPSDTPLADYRVPDLPAPILKARFGKR